jgi:translation initiation factor IF-2
LSSRVGQQKQGLEDLPEAPLLVADEAKIVANPNRSAQGTVIEARSIEPRCYGYPVGAKRHAARRHDYRWHELWPYPPMFDFLGKRIATASPSTPVSVLGLSEVPIAGQIFEVVESEKAAREKIATDCCARGTGSGSHNPS